jgi:4,5-dihydroxyphthalate decarboxylase
MTTSTALELATVFNGNNPCLAPLRDGRVKIDGVEMRQMPVPNIIVPFRWMARHMPYDISEQAVVCYMVSRRYGLPVTALPIFPSSNVDEGGGILVNRRSGVRTAKDLEGKAIGMRAYTTTPTSWQIDYLRSQGCDTEKVTFISNDEEHQFRYHADAPPNVVYRKGANLERMLKDGELAGVFSTPIQDADPDIVPLNPNARADGIANFKSTGIFHPIHLMLVKNDVVRENPWILRSVYDAFKRAKAEWLAEQATPPEPWDDPLPIGLTQTRKSLERLMAIAVDIHVLERPMDIEELFPGDFLD